MRINRSLWAISLTSLPFTYLSLRTSLVSLQKQEQYNCMLWIVADMAPSPRSYQYLYHMSPSPSKYGQKLSLHELTECGNVTSIITL